MKNNANFIVCKCGKRIPMSQNVILLGEKIDAHCEEHKNRISDIEKAEVEVYSIYGFLVEQAFIKAAET
jgi:hypothetical protein